MSDTIYALSSGALPAAIAIVRLSGPGAFDAVEALGGKLPPPRRASLRVLRHRDDVLDRALVVTFPGPATATGEDLAELHLHGGRAVVRGVGDALAAMGLRAAEAGEFTRRALTNGRIDLTEAEGLADLLAAQSEAQRRAALRAAEGGIRSLVEEWAARALSLSAQVEAMLDHADEDDVAESDPHIGDQAAALAADIRQFTDRPTVDRLHDGLRVVLAGPPNAGKSTLLNALAGRDAAIVSPIAGTTRDRIEVPVMRDGIAYLVIDTAGLHDAVSDDIERIGIERTRDALHTADLVLWLDDRAPTDLASPYIWVMAQSDLPGRVGSSERVGVSAITGDGVEALWREIHGAATQLVPIGDAVALNGRQKTLAFLAAQYLADLPSMSDPLLQAETLKLALLSFHRITGKADVEAMLDALFGRFCIGK